MIRENIPRLRWKTVGVRPFYVRVQIESRGSLAKALK